MDANDQNRSVDGIKTPDSQPITPSVDGISPSQPTSPAPGQTITTDPSQDTAPVAQGAAPVSHEAEVAKLKEQKKGMAIWLVVLIVILVGGLVAAGVYFWQSNQAKNNLNAQKAETAKVQQELNAQQQSSTQQQIDQLNKTNQSLNTQVTNLQKTIDAQTAYIKTLTDTANKLKTTCGNACSSITIPSPPAGVTSSTSSTSTTSSNP